MIASCNYKPKSTILQPTGTTCFFFFYSLWLLFPISSSHPALDTFYFLLDPFVGHQRWDLPGAVASRMSPITSILPMYVGFVMTPSLPWEEWFLLKETSGSQLNWLKNFCCYLLNWQLGNWFTVNNSNFYYWVSISFLKIIQILHLITWIYVFFCLCVTYCVCIMRFESMFRGKEPLK